MERKKIISLNLIYLTEIILFRKQKSILYAKQNPVEKQKTFIQTKFFVIKW